MEMSNFYFYRDKWKINCVSSYTGTWNGWTQTISTPTSIVMEGKSANVKYGGKAW